MSASQEQSAGIEQVNQAIAQMDQVTQQNASLVEEAAAAAEAMQDQARQLAQAVGAFRLDATGTPKAIRAATSVTLPRASARPAPAAAAPRPRLAKAEPKVEEWEQF
jgi:methyl-accepting chemotaxis protein